MTINEAILEIAELISKFARECDDDTYLEALGEMSERSTDAYNARAEAVKEEEPKQLRLKFDE